MLKHLSEVRQLDVIIKRPNTRCNNTIVQQSSIDALFSDNNNNNNNNNNNRLVGSSVTGWKVHEVVDQL